MISLTNDLLIKILLFILLFVTISEILKRFFKEQKAVAIVISLAISLLATFYISYEQINFLGKSYGLIGAIILIAIPSLIAFYFIYSSNMDSLFRKIFLIFYGIILITIIQGNVNFSLESITTSTTLIIIAITLIIIFDKTIRNWTKIRSNLKFPKG
jgi:small-conductance mechanosensitive channel